LRSISGWVCLAFLYVALPLPCPISRVSGIKYDLAHLKALVLSDPPSAQAFGRFYVSLGGSTEKGVLPGGNLQVAFTTNPITIF